MIPQMWAKNILMAETDVAIELRIYTSNHQTRFEYHKIDRNVNILFFYFLSCITFGIALVALRLLPYSTVPGIVRRRQFFVFHCSGEPKLQCNVIRIRGLVSNAGSVQQSFVAEFR